MQSELDRATCSSAPDCRCGNSRSTYTVQKRRKGAAAAIVRTHTVTPADLANNTASARAAPIDAAAAVGLPPAPH